MRALLLVLLLLSTPTLAFDQAQVQAACYSDCGKETGSTFKACLARAADTADGVLNQEFSALQDAVKVSAKDMGVKPDAQLDMLKEAQRKWIAFRDEACNFEDSLAFGATVTGGYLSSCICALSYGRANDFERIQYFILGQ